MEIHEYIKICPNCLQKFKTEKRIKTYCSKDCYSKFNNLNKRREPRNEIESELNRLYNRIYSFKKKYDKTKNKEFLEEIKQLKEQISLLIIRKRDNLETVKHMNTEKLLTEVGYYDEVKDGR